LIHLSVAVTNDRAIHFYERLGFSKYGTESRALKIGNEYIDEHLMVRFLNAYTCRRLVGGTTPVRLGSPPHVVAACNG
jgi:ribosomal protein S18 acetylase RimI-like enzyme